MRSPRLTDEFTEAGDDADAVYGELIHTLGDLTLSAYSFELRNLPFERKRQIYSASHLSLHYGSCRPSSMRTPRDLCPSG